MFLDISPEKRLKSDFFINEIKARNNLIIWWKHYYKISRTDERFKNLTLGSLLEDYLDYVISQMPSISTEAIENINTKKEEFQEWAEKMKVLTSRHLQNTQK